MIEVISCITLEHDLRLVLLAAFICIAGSITFNQLTRRSRFTTGFARAGWIGIGAIALCTTVWCTHFIAMLSFQAHVPVVIDPVLTMASLIAPVFGFFAAISLVIYGRTLLASIIGNTLLGLNRAGNPGGCLVGVKQR